MEDKETLLELFAKKLELRDLQKDEYLRLDWHEPDESGIDAMVKGNHLDNAFGEDKNSSELVVILTKDGEEYYRINLATLLAVACV
jgi:hypothetical protein